MLEDVTQIGMRVRAPIFWDATSVRSLCYSVRVWAPRGEANDMLSPRPRPQITFSSGWAELGAILLGKHHLKEWPRSGGVQRVLGLVNMPDGRSGYTSNGL